ncbi:MAG TPA: hypothetical protein IAB01_06020 [Candidatus Avidesulfovibrio excrementigallinarum]|nr:hypothetical protein [Candidatus Avidesulfovibrio excrementigallinarum]
MNSSKVSVNRMVRINYARKVFGREEKAQKIQLDELQNAVKAEAFRRVAPSRF